MKRKIPKLIALAALMLLTTVSANAAIPGLEGTSFHFVAKTGHISTPDGNSVLIWGYADGNVTTVTAQYPGPTLIVNEDVEIQVDLTNELNVPVSIIFPGQGNVTATAISGPSQQGLLALEALPGGTVRYTFTAENAGTYMYQSGTRQDLQVEMGLFGALIVRPTGFDHMMPTAYPNVGTDFTMGREFLFLLSEMDSRIHELVESGLMDQVDNTAFFANYWFINGRCAPDTMAPDGPEVLEHQPYGCMPMMHPGDKLLIRLVHAGRDQHPFHHHGNDSLIIARNGRVLASTPGGMPDIGQHVFTIQAIPGETVDAIYSWTGEKLGWDVYGHPHDLDNAPTGNFPGTEDVDHNGNGSMDVVALEPGEYEPDHGKPFPVTLPNVLDSTFGAMYSGSPFLGLLANLPVGEGGMNPNGGFTYMWHSHTEKEMTNFDIFPGGLMTMLIIEHPSVVINH